MDLLDIAVQSEPESDLMDLASIPLFMLLQVVLGSWTEQSLELPVVGKPHGASSSSGQVKKTPQIHAGNWNVF